jgi:branched-chain amino acid transport system substrate-binding protein
MTHCYRQLIPLLCGGLLILWVSGCGRESVHEELVLKVGVIASLSDAERLAGQTTVACARVIAEYHNEKGGFEVEGERYRIELLVKDDVGDPVRAVEIASDFVRAGDVHYVIGPEEDAICEAVAPVLDSAGIWYVYSGFSHPLLEGASYGVLAEPRPIQLFSCIADYLQENEEALSICVLAGNSKPAMHQKLRLERMLESAGQDVVRFSSFDVAEQVFDPLDAPASIRSCMDRLVSTNPDAVILCGQRHGTLSLALSYLRGSGYAGAVYAREPQSADDFQQVRLMADELFLVGVSGPIDERSDYYLDLKNRYLDQSLGWDIDVDLKLYALESLLRGIAQCGRDALSSSGPLLDLIDSIGFTDPFLMDERLMGFVSRDALSVHQQLSVPILITKYSGGKAQVVHRSDLSH